MGLTTVEKVHFYERPVGQQCVAMSVMLNYFGWCLFCYLDFLRTQLDRDPTLFFTFSSFSLQGCHGFYAVRFWGVAETVKTKNSHRCKVLLKLKQRIVS